MKYVQCRSESNHWLVAVSISLSIFLPFFLRHNILFSYIFHSLCDCCRSPVWGPWQMSAPAHSRTLRGREGSPMVVPPSLLVPSVGCLQLGVSMSDQIIFPMQVQQREMHIFHSMLLGGCTWGVFHETSWYYFHPARVGEIEMMKRQMVRESQIWVAWAKARFRNIGHGNVAELNDSIKYIV